MTRHSKTLVHGAIGGVIAATVLALWFFIFDAIRGDLFFVPGFVASVLFNLGHVSESAGVIIGYTALHYAVFIVVSIALAYLLRGVGKTPGLFLGLVIGFLFFDLIFYAGLIISGANIIKGIGWPEVLIGDCLSGIALMLYLGAVHEAPTIAWGAELAASRTLREGVISGLIGAVAVAVWMAIVNLAYGRVLFTPAALGSALFYGARHITEVHADVTTVIGYTVIHVVLFVAAGWVAAAMLTKSEETPPLILGLVLLVVSMEALFIGVTAIFAQWILGYVGWWAILGGNIIGGVAMGLYLWKAHPRLAMRLRERPLEDPT